MSTLSTMMDRFVTKRRRTTGPSVSSTPSPQIPSTSSIPAGPQPEVPSSYSIPAGPQPEVPSSSSIPAPSTQAPPAVFNQFARWNLQRDPALRKPISSYHPNDQDNVRRAYLQMGPMQPINFPFPQKTMGIHKPINRRFNEEWFEKYGNLLEYSISKDAAYCLYCFLFRNSANLKGVSDAFVSVGFSNWSQPKKLEKHVGLVNSVHNIAYLNGRDLMLEEQHIQTIYLHQTVQESLGYRIRLDASIDILRFLLCQGLPARGHDESEASLNQGNFLELLRYTAEHNDIIKSEVLKNAPGNNKLTSPDIQKQIVSAAAMETMDLIRKDIGDALFAVMVDESRDVTVREQMAVCIRYVNKKGYVIESFIGIIHVLETSAISLKNSVDALFSKYGLYIMRLRGQCYDGASNMQGEYNGIKALILKENPSAYVIHYFSHQLQLALMNVAQKHVDVSLFFTIVNEVDTIVSASCKHREVLREKELARVVEIVEKGERLSGSGLNQETCMKRPSDTRWGTHYNTLLSLTLMFPSILDVLEIVSREGTSEARGKAYAFLIFMPTFDFVFTLFLVSSLLGMTSELSQALQRKDQDIVNAMNLVKISEDQLQAMRDGGWDSLMKDISAFYAKNTIEVPEMMSPYVPFGRSRRNLQEETNLHHFQVGLFNHVIDQQIAALNDRFDEVNTELLLCMSHLNPRENFSAFDKGVLIRLAELYPSDFSEMDLMVLDRQLDAFLDDVLSSVDFFELDGISGLSKKMVETKRDIVYPLVYLLITLSLILPVATATVERVFSAMKIVKNRLRSCIGDEYLNNCLLTYIERELFRSVTNDKIRERFQGMAPRADIPEYQMVVRLYW